MLTVLFAPAEGGGGGMGMFIMIASFIAIFYFLLIRPQRQQQKRHQEMVNNLRRGDEVATVGGVIGQIIHIKDDRLTIKSADDTRLVIERDKVARKLTGPAAEGES